MLLAAGVILAASLTACGSAEPTPPPVLTLPESLPLAATATVATKLPRLPNDLTYLQAGKIWTLPAHTQQPKVLAEVAAGSIVDYRINRSGEVLAFRTGDDLLYVVNRTTGDRVDVQLPFARSFVGFTLSPDGTYLAVGDANGLYAITLPEGTLTEVKPNPTSEEGATTWIPTSWSDDNRWLIANLAVFDNYPLYLIDVRTGELRELMQGCVGEVPQGVWDTEGVWLATTSCGEPGGLHLVKPVGGLDWPVLRSTPEEASQSLIPYGWEVITGDRLAFTQYDLDSGYPTGLYWLDADNSLIPILTAACITSEGDRCLPIEYGFARWAPDGAAFSLYGVENDIVIGELAGATLWDVSRLLEGATNFQWSFPFK